MAYSCTTGMVGVLFSSRQLIFKWINVCGIIRHLCNVLFSVPGYFLCYQIILGMTLSKRGWLAMRDRCCVCSKMKKMRLVQKTISEILKRKVWKTVLAQLFGKSNQLLIPNIAKGIAQDIKGHTLSFLSPYLWSWLEFYNLEREIMCFTKNSRTTHNQNIKMISY